MAFEVAEEGVVVGGQVADRVVEFGGGVDDRGGMVGEAGQVSTVLLGEERLDFHAGFGVVELEGVIVAGGQEKFPRVVKVQGRHRGFGLAKFELLDASLAGLFVIRNLGINGVYLGCPERPYNL